MSKVKIRRRVLASCLAYLFCFTSSLTVFAAAAPSNADEIPENPPSAQSEMPDVSDSGNPEPPKAQAQVLVTTIQSETELASLPSFTLPLRTTPSNDDLAGIYRLALQYQIISATVTADGDSREETFSVAWDFSAIDQTALGEYTAVGRIELPEGYAFGENVLRELQIPVRVEEMPPVVITSVERW